MPDNLVAQQSLKVECRECAEVSALRGKHIKKTRLFPNALKKTQEGQLNLFSCCKWSGLASKLVFISCRSRTRCFANMFHLDPDERPQWSQSLEFSRIKTLNQIICVTLQEAVSHKVTKVQRCSHYKV